jgi:multiple sugar transport system permease protein
VATANQELVASAERNKNSIVQGERLAKWGFLGPGALAILLLSIFPLIFSLGILFSNANLSRIDAVVSRFPTLDNLSRMVSDERLWVDVRNTLIFVIGGVTLQYWLGLGLALLLNQRLVGRRIIRTIFLLPMMATPIATAYMMRIILDPGNGPVADILRHLHWVVPRMLTDTSLAPLTIVLIDTWQWAPFMMIVLLAGLQGISDELYEAALVDGANLWQVFWKITFPLLGRLSVTVILIRVFEVFKIVDVIKVATGGGPGQATESLSLYVYQIYRNGDLGYASAIAYVLLVVLVLGSTGFLAAARRVVRA